MRCPPSPTLTPVRHALLPAASYSAVHTAVHPPASAPSSLTRECTCSHLLGACTWPCTWLVGRLRGEGRAGLGWAATREPEGGNGERGGTSRPAGQEQGRRRWEGRAANGRWWVGHRLWAAHEPLHPISVIPAFFFPDILFCPALFKMNFQKLRSIRDASRATQARRGRASWGIREVRRGCASGRAGRRGLTF